MRRVLSFFACVLALTALDSCVLGPLEHSNYHDPKGNARITIHGVPDSLFSRQDFFQVTATATPPLPSPLGAAAPTFYISSGSEVLTQFSMDLFVVSNGAGYLPQPAIVRVGVSPHLEFPTDEDTVWVRQRPDSLEMWCTPTPGCLSLPTVAAFVRDFQFAAWDANGFMVAFPTGAFRFGTLVSRNPTIAHIVDRPTPTTFRIGAGLPGTTWIVLSGDGRADSVQFTVTP